MSKAKINEAAIRIREGDRRAEGELYQLVFDYVEKSYRSRFAGMRSAVYDVEDLAQDVALDAIKAASKGYDGNKFIYILNVIIRRLVSKFQLRNAGANIGKVQSMKKLREAQEAETVSNLDKEGRLYADKAAWVFGEVFEYQDFDHIPSTKESGQGGTACGEEKHIPWLQRLLDQARLKENQVYTLTAMLDETEEADEDPVKRSARTAIRRVMRLGLIEKHAAPDFQKHAAPDPGSYKQPIQLFLPGFGE